MRQNSVLRGVCIAVVVGLLSACGGSFPNHDARIFGSPEVSSEALSRYLVVRSDVDRIVNSGWELDVEGRSGDRLIVYVPQTRASEFETLAPDARLDARDIGEAYRRLEAEHSPLLETLYNFTKVEAELKQIQSTYPTFAKLIVYGHSRQGRNLYALELTGQAPSKPTDEGKPAVMITGATHGNEVLTVDVVMGFAKELTASYGKDDRVTNMLNGARVLLVPVVSPDSYASQSRYVNGVDPNREYPWPDRPSRSPTDVIKAVMDFAATNQIKGSIDYHSAAAMIMYPWAYTETAPRDTSEFEQVAGEMNAANGYEAGQISRILYVAQGSSADYYYWKFGSLSFGVELSQGEIVSEQAPSNMYTENRESTFRFIEHFSK